MSLSSLPTELVRQIIESSIPSTFHSTTYDERRSTLRNLCLVSHRFLLIAQPLLFEIVWIRSLAGLDDFLAALDKRGGLETSSQTMVFNIETEPASEALVRLATSCRGLANLSADLSIEEALDFGILQSFRDLRDLQLAGDVVSDSPIVLPHLETLFYEGAVTDTVTNLLRPAALPSLRNLAVEFTALDHHAFSTIERLEHLIPQLDTLFLGVAVLQYTPNRLSLPLDRILFRLTGMSLPEFERLQDIHHLQIARSSKSFLLSQLASHIQNQDTIRLESIFLDISLDPAASPGADEEVQPDDLLRVCSEKAITVVYEEQGREWIDPWIPEEFRRRQRKCRRLKGDQAT